MSKLQDENVQPELDLDQSEPEDTGSELATDSPGEGEENTKSDGEKAVVIDGVSVEGPEGFKKAINKQHWKFREKEREALEEKRKREELERRIEELEGKRLPENTVVDIPPIPEPWEENYDQKIRARDKAILRKAKFDAQQEQQRRELADAERAKQIKQLEEQEAWQATFLGNAKKLGIDRSSLDTAQKAIIDYGVTPEIAKLLCSDSDGPLFVQYLAANPLDLHDLVSSDQFNAGMKFHALREKLSSFRSKPTSAPDPATTVEGGAVPPKERGPKGATYE